jgi:hypothetical protein
MAETLEMHRGEIFHLYIGLDRTANEVIESLKMNHNLDVS